MKSRASKRVESIENMHLATQKRAAKSLGIGCGDSHIFWVAYGLLIYAYLKSRASNRVKLIENMHLLIPTSPAAVALVSGSWLWLLPHALGGPRVSYEYILGIPRF